MKRSGAAPDLGPDTEADPSLRSEIGRPAQGQRIASEAFEKVSGTASIDGGKEITLVDVALARKQGEKCGWWQPEKNRFATRSCSKPFWFEAKGTERWTWQPGGSPLPAGRYRALSKAYSEGAGEECCELGRNLVEFRLK